MKINKDVIPMRLLISSTHIRFTKFNIRFTKFNIINERVGGRHVEIENDGHLVARLFNEDAQEFIKLMEEE